MLFALSCALVAIVAQPSASVRRLLPRGAYIVESRSLAANGYPELSLVLWMFHPERHPDTTEESESYTCPDETRGSYLVGPTRVSLLDRSLSKVVNTIELRGPDLPDVDRFELPYLVRSGFYYRVSSSRSGRAGRPTILDLRDLNGDGRALEFALYEKDNCTKVMTMLVGFSERQRRVIAYPAVLRCDRDGRLSRETWDWVDYLLLERPIRPGHWSYDLTYMGTPLHFDVKYDRVNERLVGTYRERQSPE